MNSKNLFKEFMVLGYYPGTKISSLTDIPTSNYTIIRVTRDGWNVISFRNGTNIYIPWELVDLFSSLNTWGGQRIIECSEAEDNVDSTIIDFLRLVNFINKKQGDSFIEILSKICSTGTGEFREWFQNNFKKSIRPIELNTLDKFRII